MTFFAGSPMNLEGNRPVVACTIGYLPSPSSSCSYATPYGWRRTKADPPCLDLFLATSPFFSTFPSVSPLSEGLLALLRGSVRYTRRTVVQGHFSRFLFHDANANTNPRALRARPGADARRRYWLFLTFFFFFPKGVMQREMAQWFQLSQGSVT